MNKIYGFKIPDVKALARYVREGGFEGKTLTQSFADYAALTGKAAGSIRNLYYALAALSVSNAQFTRCMLDGKPIKVKRAETFSDAEKKLMDKITELKNDGVSVRKATFILADGDVKKALRYQNKYRASAPRVEAPTDGEKNTVVSAKDFLAARLKKEIDALANRLTAGLKRENTALKRQVAFLNAENARLQRELHSADGRGGAAAYFGRMGHALGSQPIRR